MIHSSFASKLEDYAHLRERNSKHSRDISRLQRELDDLKLQQGMLKQEMTPRDGPSTHRVLGTERRPEMYFPKPGGEESLKPPKDRDTTEDESGDKKPYFLDLGKDNSPRDQPDSTRDKHDDRRPEMYGGDEDKPKDPIRRNDRPVYIERRPEYYWSGEYSPRKDDNFDVEELRKRDRENKYSFYDTTAINPQDWKKNESGRKYPYYDHSKMACPGGLGIMRFRDSAFERAKIAIQKLQSVMRTTGGYTMGMCKKDALCVYETAASKELSWVPSRDQVSPDFMRTEDALAVFWFTCRDAAEHFFACRHENRFKEPQFPEPDGHESFYCPLIIAPSAKPMPTFLLIEILNARHCSLDSFERELKAEMLKLIPTCLPIVSSSVNGRQYFKPGNMVRPYSKCIIGRFECQRHVDEIWRSGLIQYLLQSHNLVGQANIASFTISEVR